MYILSFFFPFLSSLHFSLCFSTHSLLLLTHKPFVRLLFVALAFHNEEGLSLSLK